MNIAALDWWYRGGGGGGAVSPILQAGLDYISLKGYTPLSDASKIALNVTFTDPIFIALYAASPRMYIHHGDFDSDVACIDWKNPSDATLALKVNSPTYTNKGGFTGNGSSSYLNYQLNLSTQGDDLYTLLDAGIFSANASDPANTTTLYGITNTQLYPRQASLNRAIYRINDGTTSNTGTSSVLNGNGNWDVRRISGTKYVYRNGVLVSSAGVAAVEVLNSIMTGLATNGAEAPTITPSLFYSGRIDCFIPYKASLISFSDIHTMWENHKSRIAAL